MTQSEFFMWRAVFAFAFVNNLITLEERHFLNNRLRTENFSPAEKEILKRDLQTPKDVEWLFTRIETDEDRRNFCHMARALAWSKGDMDRQEEKILEHISHLAAGEGKAILKQSRQKNFIKEHYDAYTSHGMDGIFHNVAPRKLKVSA